MAGYIDFDDYGTDVLPTKTNMSRICSSAYVSILCALSHLVRPPTRYTLVLSGPRNLPAAPFIGRSVYGF